MSSASRKPSGLSWTPTVPSHWDVANIRRFAQMKTGHTPSRSNPEYWWDCSIPWFTLADVWQLRDGKRMYIESTENQISQLGLANSAAELLPERTVVLSRTASVGFSGIMKRPMATSQDFWNWVCGPRLLPEFLVYVFRGMRAEFEALMIGSTHKTIYQHVAAAIRIPVPPIEEQQAIADFLDRETIGIDTLTQEQYRLNDMLRERRDAAWAGDLDQIALQAPMIQLRRVIESIIDGPFGSSLTSAHYVESGVRVIRLGNIGINEFKNEDMAFISSDYAATLLAHAVHADDVVVAGLGDERMPLGRASVVPDIGPAIVKADCYRIRPTRAILPSYLAWALSAPPTRNQMALLARGATRMRLNTSVVREVAIPVPEIETQRQIVAQSRQQLAKIDTLIAETERFIELSKERRAALITAAVTGQIDVRGEAA
ncbi:restriction endonuclease subunit S [Mycolicibacterium sp. ND9-15]|uniref:restriction endonuclease subunit S n=1 Tax=Mycolicibacterium sp. ND9-15 TaxID=3042320 RepID=UPI002DD85F15|nr:restriction endonuclease subunit S [Mycolicibacterium sp. ND9-15]WSE57124.1 restriction endonuclease subunit S [Mycolicibacterium sp. ND9-15]